MLSVFSYDVHNHVTVPFALKWFFGFAAVFTGVCYLITYTFPGKIAVPRTFPYNGLERELGGPHNPVCCIFKLSNMQARKDETSTEESVE